MKKNILYFIVGFIVISSIGLVAYEDFKKNNKETATKVEQEKIIKKSELSDMGLDEKQLEPVKKVKEIQTNEHLLGEAGAPIKIIVYSDFASAYSEKYYRNLIKTKEEFKDKIVIAFRNFPLVKINPNSFSAALVAECAGEQGKYLEMNKILWDNSKNNELGIEQYKKDAADLKLDETKFSQCLVSEKYKNKIDTEIAEAGTYNVNGAPTTFVNDEIVIGANPYEDTVSSDGREIEGLKSIIERQLK